ncbi:ral guanine nucleotide dissociation stimulator-like [Saccopteryx leptura]|uniref:ral guanine nucleotide dissociation stimulator-like n=1 Tax=Saccopteryx leptura TaxID=249018 RepID=UPI00339CEF8E
MDVELFKKVVPHQCRASMWSQRNKPGKEHLTSTVCATVKHFNCVVTCVITTCLGDPSMKARDRAKVVEHWIEVAKECRALRNFSSLHAILSALRSTSVHRLQKTWKKVSRRNSYTMQKLCKEEDRSGIRGLLIEEQPSRLATLILRLRGAQRKLPKKCVPFLGTFLSDLDKLGTAMDCVKGTHVSLEIEKEEQNVMEEIVLRQEAAEKYKFEPKEQFRVWFQAQEQLSETESYILSCQLEPRS